MAKLERMIGEPLLQRSAGGIEPTARGRELYLQVADHLDHLEDIFGLIEGDRPRDRRTTVRFGSSPEYFALIVLPLLVDLDIPVAARFGDDEALIGALLSGEVDLIVTSRASSHRLLATQELGHKDFILVCSPMLRKTSFDTVAKLADWLERRPWVSYSPELPLTRRFWNSVLGRSFPSRLQLTVPDLRAVAAAVELGLGVSLLPSFISAASIADGSLRELYPVRDLVPVETWALSSREGDANRAALLLAEVLRRRHSDQPPK